MIEKGDKVGFPREFSIYLPILEKQEQEELNVFKEEFKVNDSLVKLSKFLLEYIENKKAPSINLLFVVGKILFSISDFKSLENFEKGNHYSTHEVPNSICALRLTGFAVIE